MFVVALSLAAVPAIAQTVSPGDPYAGDPVGIVAAPCPAHPSPTDGAGWEAW